MSKKATSESAQTVKSELIFAGYFAEHNSHFSNIDHHFEICKRTFLDSSISEHKKIPSLLTKVQTFQRPKFWLLSCAILTKQNRMLLIHYSKL